MTRILYILLTMILCIFFYLGNTNDNTIGFLSIMGSIFTIVTMVLDWFKEGEK